MRNYKLKYPNSPDVLAIVKDHKEHIQKHWALNVYYEVYRNGVLNHIFINNPKKCKIIDIGASIGNHTLFFAGVMNAEVISFEPDPESFAHLKENVELNGFDVKLINAALGEKTGKCSMMKMSETNIGMKQVIEGNEVDLIRLDDVPEVEGYGVIKIDVEHYNKELLTGAAETLTKGTGKVYIEAETPDVLRDTDRIMKRYGYERVQGLKLNKTPTYLYKK